MSPLALLLITKIGVTALTVSLPFLLLSPARIVELSGFRSDPPVFYRLYGWAILALLVGYAGGLVEVQRGSFPWGVVVMGLVSNGGAATILITSGAAAGQRALTAFFASITAGLLVAAASPEWAIAPL